MFLITILVCCLVPGGASMVNESCWWRMQSNGRCYLLSDYVWDFIGARMHCRACGGYLATARSQLEVDILLNVSQGFTDAWLGLIYSVDGDGIANWHWEDGRSTLTWSNWQSGQPDNLPPGNRPPNGYEYCVEITNNGKWSNVNCYTRWQFFCETPGPNCLHAGN